MVPPCVGFSQRVTPGWGCILLRFTWSFLQDTPTLSQLCPGCCGTPERNKSESEAVRKCHLLLRVYIATIVQSVRRFGSLFLNNSCDQSYL